jgi:hypothetical protein
MPLDFGFMVYSEIGLAESVNLEARFRGAADVFCWATYP